MNIFKNKDMERALEYGVLLERHRLKQKSASSDKGLMRIFVFLFFINMIFGTDRVTVFISCMFAIGSWFMSRISEKAVVVLENERKRVTKEFMEEDMISHDLMLCVKEMFKNE